MTAKIPMMIGESYADIVSWIWNRSAMRYEASPAGHELRVYFHKLGGRWSKTFADGTPNTHQKRRGYWTASVDGDHPHRLPECQFATAHDAQFAAVERLRRQLGTELRQTLGKAG